MNPKPITRIAIIGFGEAGGVFGQDFSDRGLKVAATDILLREGESREKILEKARNAKVCVHEGYKEAICDAELVISAVTSSSSVDAARVAAPLLQAGQIYLDINSVSPEKKREIARIIGGSRGKFVEAAVMAPVSPQRLKVPILLAGSMQRRPRKQRNWLKLDWNESEGGERSRGSGLGHQDVPQRADQRNGSLGGGVPFAARR